MYVDCIYAFFNFVLKLLDMYNVYKFDFEFLEWHFNVEIFTIVVLYTIKKFMQL